uniref:Tumor necrosis factor receptor superfamily member 6B-like n=1 Tax=Neolamprologus brichardi TaxID=32507 RepID=A0A3Q4N9X7_NEOBR
MSVIERFIQSPSEWLRVHVAHILQSSVTSGTLYSCTHRDPITGSPVSCDRCPPGTYLRSQCSSERKSDCAKCPHGSFTEVWNHIGRCLRCGVCSHNQVVKTLCTADRDCQCQCKPGYYYKPQYDMCLPHSACPPGQGVRAKGTPDEDTVCQTCSDGTFSEVSSAHHNCTEHKSCSGAGLGLALRGSSWHDNVCANCRDLKDQKLQRVDSQLKTECRGNEVEMVDAPK